MPISSGKGKKRDLETGPTAKGWMWHHTPSRVLGLHQLELCAVAPKPQQPLKPRRWPCPPDTALKGVTNIPKLSPVQCSSIPALCLLLLSVVGWGMWDMGHGMEDIEHGTWDMRHRTWDTGHLPAALPNPAHPKEAPEPKWSSNIFVLSFT